MRISEYYNLDRTQPTLDFVDVDTEGDTRVFVDPRALRMLPSEWGDECVSLVQNFFRTVLKAIKNNDNEIAEGLLRSLREPNETHLGLSRGRSRGRAIGPESAVDVWDALSKSEAAKSGLLEELEDTILMVEGISSDIISDITTNIIREPLIYYTQWAANYYGIPLTEGVNSGPLWDANNSQWYSKFTELPITEWGKILLIPKAIVRTRLEYNVGEYYRYYLLEHLRTVELNANSGLVELLKNGRRRVTSKDLITKYGEGKAAIVRETRNHPEILEAYRSAKRASHQPPLNHIEIASSEGTLSPNWDELLNAVKETPVGKDAFSQYEKTIEALLTAAFYPSLTNPQLQTKIHDGRKRIDITYTNVATTGFFSWLSMHYSAPHIFIECKNYGSELGNPELDQMSGRFSPSRGQFGIILCRKFDDKDLFIRRCSDTARDHRGFIIPLDDDDLEALINEIKGTFMQPQYNLLSSRFQPLIF